MKQLNKNQINYLRHHWKLAKKAEDEFYEKIKDIEFSMSSELDIPDLEIFFCDGSMVGIGNAGRTIKLILKEELEK